MADNNANQSGKKNYFNPSEAMGSMNNTMHNMNKTMNNFFDFNNMQQQFAKNMEAFNAASQAVLNFSNDAFRRATELAHKNSQHLAEAAHCTSSCHTMEEARSKQAHALSAIMQDSLHHAKENLEGCAKTAKEVVDTCNQRISEAFSHSAKQQA